MAQITGLNVSIIEVLWWLFSYTEISSAMSGHVQVLKWGFALFICHSEVCILFHLYLSKMAVKNGRMLEHVRQTSTHAECCLDVLYLEAANVKKLRKTLVNL